MYDSGVAGDHDQAGDDEGHNQLVPGEVDPSQYISISQLSSKWFSPDIVVCIVAVGHRCDMCAVGIVVSEYILVDSSS